MKHFKEHVQHIYNGYDKKVLDLKGNSGKIIEEVKNIHFQEHLELIKKNNLYV